MRYPEGHNAAVRGRIVEVASRAFRRDGLDAVSIPKLMKSIGLTHGSFYVHFTDRDELVSEAIAFCAQDSAFTQQANPGEAFAKYLSKEHVRYPELGCVIAALGEEGARKGGRVGSAFARAAKGFLQFIEDLPHRKREPRALSDETLRKASMIVGAVVLARLVHDDALAGRLLSAARQSVSH